MDFDFNGMLQRLSGLAPEWDPFPVLNQLNAGGGMPGAPTTGIAPGEWDWMNNTVAKASMPPTVPIPGDPTKVQTGAMAGTTLPTPPAASAGATPLTPAQMMALRQMQPQQADQTLRPPGAVAPPSGASRPIQFTPIGLPQVQSPMVAPSFAQIFGRR